MKILLIIKLCLIPLYIWMIFQAHKAVKELDDNT